MERLDNRFPNRKNPRLKQYDYATENYYFVTICTADKKCIFGSPNHLNTFGKLSKEGLQLIGTHFSTVKVDKFVVMPNHIHAIIILSADSVKLTTVVGSYKSYVTKKIHEIDPKIKVWQSSFHDHVIRNQQSYEKNLELYRIQSHEMGRRLFLLNLVRWSVGACPRPTRSHQ